MNEWMMEGRKEGKNELMKEGRKEGRYSVNSTKREIGTKRKRQEVVQEKSRKHLARIKLNTDKKSVDKTSLQPTL